MYKELSEKAIKNIYSGSTQAVVNIYFDDVLVNPKYILDFKLGGEVFDETFELGSVFSQYVELKIHKQAKITKPNKIKIEYGVLVNNALTVAEVNKMLVCDLNNLIVKSLSKHNDSFEMMPIGVYNIDDYNEEDDNVINIKALDNIIKLDVDDGYYDARELIKDKGYATLGEIAEDICKKKGLKLETSSFTNSNKRIAVYDNQIKARQYMSYIAEKAGGICCASREGKIQIKQLGKDTEKIPQNLFKTYKWGEEHQISRVAYENGTESFKIGDETKETLWIRQDNLFISDEDDIQNIYDEIKDMSIYSFEGTVIINPAVDIGDFLDIDGKLVIYQGEMAFNKRFIADIKSQISIKQKQETTTKTISQQVINRRVQSTIDEIEGKITQLIQDITNTSEKTNKIESTIDGTTQTIKNLEDGIGTIEELKTSIEGIKNTLKTQGGFNLLRNSVGIFGKEYWEGSITQYQDTEVFQNNISKSAIMLPSGNILQNVNPLKNGTYNISFNYKKRVQAAAVKVSINGTEETLTGTSWTAYEKTIKITNNKFTIKFISDTANSCLISDLILIPGESKNTWSQNINETSSETVQIGEGIQVESTKTNTYTRIDSDGNRTFNKSTNEVVTEQTDKGTRTNNLIVITEAEITGLLQQQHEDQVWLNVL